MTISKAILPSNQRAHDFKEALDSWNIPARLIKNESRCVLFDAKALTTSQLANLERDYEPVFVKLSILDVLLMSEVEK